MPYREVDPNSLKLDQPATPSATPQTAPAAPAPAPAAPAARPAAAPSKYGEIDPNVKLDAPQTGGGDPSTLGEIGAGLSRALAPVAAGAAVGAGIGSVVPGPGTAFGAGMGALAVGGTEAVLQIYNVLADQMGWNKWVTPKEATNTVFSHLGIKAPQTSLGRDVEAAAGAAADTLSITGGARQIATRAAPGIVRGIAEKVAARPAAQVASAAAGGAAGQESRELGASPLVSWLVSLGVSSITPPVRGSLLPGTPHPTAVTARNAGYVLPPGEISPQPGAVSQLAAGEAGKVKNWQFASMQNQRVTDALAAREVGLPPGTQWTEALFDSERNKWGQEYQALANSLGGGPITTMHANPAPQVPGSPLNPPPMVREQQFTDDIRDIIEPYVGTAQHFPDTSKIPPMVRDVYNDLSNLTAFPINEGLQKIRQWRYQSQRNFMARNDPDRFELATAQRKAANAVEELIDRQLSRTGNPGMIDRMRNARQMIAKLWDIQTSLRGGYVSAMRLASLGLMNRAGARPRELTGGLKTIADVYNRFPRSMQVPLGPNEEISVLDMFGGLFATLASGHAAGLAGLVLRPAARHTIFSGPYQWWQTRGGQAMGLPPASRRMTRPWSPAGAVLTGQAGEANDPTGDLSPYYSYDTGFGAITGEVPR